MRMAIGARSIWMILATMTVSMMKSSTTTAIIMEVGNLIFGDILLTGIVFDTRFFVSLGSLRRLGISSKLPIFPILPITPIIPTTPMRVSLTYGTSLRL